MSLSLQRFISIILACAGLCIMTQLYIPIPIMGVFAAAFHVSPQEALWVISAFGFSYASGFLVFGPLSDKYGRKNLMVFGLGGLFVSTVLVGFSSSFEMLILCRVLQGFLASAFTPAALSYINEKIDVKIRATSIAFMTCGFMLAGITGQMYAEIVSNHESWSWIFLGISVAYFILVIAMGCLLEKTAKSNEIEKLSTIYRYMLRHFMSRSLFPLYVISFFLLLAFVAFYAGLGNHLMSTYHLANGDIFYIRAAAIPGMLTALLVGKYIRQYGTRKVIFCGLSFMIAGLMGIVLVENIIVLMILSIVFVSGISITAPAVIAEIGQKVTVAKGAAIALYTFILFIGASLGPVFSQAFDSFFYVCMALSLCIILSMMIKKMVGE